ncbi:hypothetical protein G5576_016199 [Homo sapiens]|uniref:INO80 complex subunit C n=1 Tax=Homo sapiens TaxID=9606 RepID=K7ENP7_HUMAN|nr:hypothetical protein KI723_180377 [Homo sapiens]KAI4046006.1 hypothetical protein G5576_016199 [Homo sapiens]
MAAQIPIVATTSTPGIVRNSKKRPASPSHNGSSGGGYGASKKKKASASSFAQVPGLGEPGGEGTDYLKITWRRSLIQAQAPRKGHARTQGEGQLSVSQKEPSLETKSARTFILDFPAFRDVKK